MFLANPITSAISSLLQAFSMWEAKESWIKSKKEKKKKFLVRNLCSQLKVDMVYLQYADQFTVEDYVLLNQF